MSKLTPTRGAQWPLVAEFVFNMTDTVVTPAGVEESLAIPGPHTFDAIKLPVNAAVIGGEVVTELALTGATATVAVGDSVSNARYLPGTDQSTIKRTPLVLTGYLGAGEDIRLVVVTTGTATAGRIVVRVQYVIRNRVNETQTT